MTHAISLQKPLPATATAIDFTAFLLLSNFLFDVLGFFSGLVSTFFNVVINLGLFFLSGLA